MCVGKCVARNRLLPDFSKLGVLFFSFVARADPTRDKRPFLESSAKHREALEMLDRNVSPLLCT